MQSDSSVGHMKIYISIPRRAQWNKFRKWIKLGGKWRPFPHAGLLDMCWPLKQKMAAKEQDPMPPSTLYQCIASIMAPVPGNGE